MVIQSDYIQLKDIPAFKDKVVGRGLQVGQKEAITLGSQSSSTDVPEARRHSDPPWAAQSECISE